MYDPSHARHEGGSKSHAFGDVRIFLNRHYTEADLGMFNMFGRTEAPTKKGPPQEDRQFFAT